MYPFDVEMGVVDRNSCSVNRSRCRGDTSSAIEIRCSPYIHTYVHGREGYVYCVCVCVCERERERERERVYYFYITNTNYYSAGPRY